MQDLAKGGNKRANETLIRFLGDMKGTEATREKGEISDLCAVFDLWEAEEDEGRQAPKSVQWSKNWGYDDYLLIDTQLNLDEINAVDNDFCGYSKPLTKVPDRQLKQAFVLPTLTHCDV